MKKYELTDKTLVVLGKTLHQIKALKRIVISEGWRMIEEGSLGGYIESEENLSQEDTCWVGEGAKVFDNVRITGKTVIFGNVYIYENAQIKGTFEIHGTSLIDSPLKINSNAVLEIKYDGEPEDFCMISCEDTTISGKLISSEALTIKGINIQIESGVNIQGHDIEIIGKNIKLLGDITLKGNFINMRGEGSVCGNNLIIENYLPNFD